MDFRPRNPIHSKAPMQNDVVELGGRKLQVISAGPVVHDVWLMQQVRAAGIDHVDMTKGQSADDLVDAMLNRVLASGSALRLLGSLLAPADLDLVDWTPTVAADMEKFLGRLMAAEDKAAIRGLLAQALAGFFASGIASLRTSRTSSAGSPLADGPAIPDATGAEA